MAAKTPAKGSVTVSEFVRGSGMSRRVSPRFLAEGHQIRLADKIERDHLWKSYKSLTRCPPRKTCNPRYVTKFVGNARRFEQWSRENGFSIDAELVLVNARVIPDTKLDCRWTKNWVNGTLVLEQEWDVEDDPSLEIPPECWITDYDVQWVPLAELVRAKPLPPMPRYNLMRVRAARKAMREQLRSEVRAAKELKVRRSRKGKRPKLITAWGETKSANAWARDTRATVSDKVISRRIAAGWKEEDAISTARGKPGPKPGKSR